MSDIWYVLHDDYTGPNGRTYRVRDDVLECWTAQRVWVVSSFETLGRLKGYALNRHCNAALYVTKPGRRITQ